MQIPFKGWIKNLSNIVLSSKQSYMFTLIKQLYCFTRCDFFWC